MIFQQTGTGINFLKNLKHEDMSFFILIKPQKKYQIIRLKIHIYDHIKQAINVSTWTAYFNTISVRIFPAL